MIRIAIETEGEQRHRTFRSPSITIGRGGTCDLSLPEVRGLSRHHCRLTVLSPGRGRLEDLGSRNRTFLNGHLVEDAEVSPGARITCGQLEFVVEALSDDEPTEELVQPCLHCGHIFTAREESCPRCHTKATPGGRGRHIGAGTFSGYTIKKKLGSGGMGIVFEALEHANDRAVALKVLRPHLGRDQAFVARFIEEVRLLTALKHPAIVKVFGRGAEKDLHYVAMELVHGHSLREILREEGRLSAERATRIAWEAAMALNAAHQQQGVIHGDVKPGNMLQDRTGRVKLCDFGLARVDLRPGMRSRTEADPIRRGTAAYAAPERFRQVLEPTIASDAYALGVSLFQMLTGRLPFTATDVQKLAAAHRQEPVPRLVACGGPSHPGLQILVDQLLAKDPRRRMRDWPSLIADLTLLLP